MRRRVRFENNGGALVANVADSLVRLSEHVIEVVRLARADERQTIEVLYREHEQPSNLFGWRYSEAWSIDQAARIQSVWISDDFVFATAAAGWGQPECLQPSSDGVAWWVHPYGGRQAKDWTFADHVENALRQYHLGARPHSRQEVEAMLADGIGSWAQLRAASTRGPHRGVARWLVSEIGDSAP